jgi:hypothetical protein
MSFSVEYEKDTTGISGPKNLTILERMHLSVTNVILQH